MSDTDTSDKSNIDAAEIMSSVGSGAERTVTTSQKNHPNRVKIAGQLQELTAAEKQADIEIGKLRIAKQRARSKFQEATQDKPTAEEELKADIEATVERAISMQNEHDTTQREKEMREEDITRDQIVEEVVALAERAKQKLKITARPGNPTTAPIKTLQTVISLSAAKSAKRPKNKLTPPLQFDFAKRVLVDCNKLESIQVPLTFVDVLQAWFQHQGPKKLKLKLSYAEIGAYFLMGRREKKASEGANTQDDKKNPKKYATRFASAFRRWLKDNHAIAAKELFHNVKAAQQYAITRDGWHKTRPMINHSENKRHLANKHLQDDESGAGAE